MDKIWTLTWQWNCSDTAEKLLSSLNWEYASNQRFKYWRLLGSGWSHRKQLNQPSVPGISLVSFSSSPSAAPFPWESPETHGWLQGKHTNMYRAVHPLIWLMFAEKWSKATAWTADWLKQFAAKCLCRRSLPESSSWLCSPRYPLHSSLSQTIKLRFDLIGATERAAITPISRSTTKKYNVKAFAKKLLCSQSQSRVVLNGAWCAANKLATFWPSPGPVWCSAEPQPWSLRTSPHLAPRRRWRRDMGPTVLPVWRLRMALPSRLLFHAAFSPCWRALCDVITSRRMVLCDVKIIIINKWMNEKCVYSILTFQICMKLIWFNLIFLI